MAQERDGTIDQAKTGNSSRYERSSLSWVTSWPDVAYVWWSKTKGGHPRDGAVRADAWTGANCIGSTGGCSIARTAALRRMRTSMVLAISFPGICGGKFPKAVAGLWQPHRCIAGTTINGWWPHERRCGPENLWCSRQRVCQKPASVNAFTAFLVISSGTSM